MSYQFLHVELYGREGAHKKNCTARKSSMFEIRDEMVRAPHACPHVAEPLPPRILSDMTPDEAFALAEERAVHALDKRGHKLRRDAPIVIAGVASWPEPSVNINNDQEKFHRYQQWRDETLAWLKRQWSDDLKCTVEHLDEPYPHLHFIIVPRLSADRRLRISTIHPGRRAAEQVAGGKGKDQKKAYKQAMAELQRDYYERVGIKFGLLRVGPRRQRLTRLELIERKRQAEELARGYRDLQTFVANVKLIVKSHVATREAKIHEATQAKIAANEAHWDHLVMTLQTATAQITDLETRQAALEDELLEKNAIIAAQATELERTRWENSHFGI